MTSFKTTISKAIQYASAGLMAGTVCYYLLGKDFSENSSQGLLSRILGYERLNTCPNDAGYRTAEEIGLGEGPKSNCTLFFPYLIKKTRHGYDPDPIFIANNTSEFVAKVAHPVLELALEGLVLGAALRLRKKK